MKSRLVVLGFAVAALAALGAVGYWVYERAGRDQRFSPTSERGDVVAAADYQLSGPYTHDNLTVYLVQGRETWDGRSVLTLQEALAQKKAVVHETGSVNELAIENLSYDQEIYIQNGDVVKGGKQDRTLPYDAIIGARSGRVPIDSFCVEQGRWSKRGEETSAMFEYSSSNTGNISSLKRAMSDREEASQAAVWRNVSRLQERLGKKLGESVKANASESSLQLTLESPAVRGALDPYLRALTSAPEGQGDVIGFVAVVNGKAVSADVFASRALFRKLWPKLLEGSAIEAFVESEAGAAGGVSEAEVRAFLAEAETLEPTGDATTQRTYVQTRQGEKVTLQESCDRARKNLVLHRSYARR